MNEPSQPRSPSNPEAELTAAESSAAVSTSAEADRPAPGWSPDAFAGRDAGIPARAWRLFRSLHLGMFLLSLIVLACIYGAVGYASNPDLGRNQVALARSSVFQAPWFAALVGLFAVQFVVSTWHVTVMSLTIHRRREYRRSERFYRPGRSPRAEVRGIDAAGMERVRGLLRERYTFLHADRGALFAHRGLASRVGPTVIHAGILAILAAGLVRFALLHQGVVVNDAVLVLPEGESTGEITVAADRRQVIGGANTERRPLPGGATVRLLDFDAEPHPGSETPAVFRALVEVTEPARGTVRVAQMDMTRRIEIDGYRLHISKYDEKPPTESNRSTFDVRDAATGARLGTPDATPGVPARIGTTDKYLVVNGSGEGARWGIFTSATPTAFSAQGTVAAQAAPARISVTPTRFFPAFRLNAENGQVERVEGRPENPALEIRIDRDGRELGRQFIFLRPGLAPRGAVDPKAPWEFSFADILVPDGDAARDLSVKGAAKFVVETKARATGLVVHRDELLLDETGAVMPFRQAVTQPTETDPTPFRVSALGPAPKYVAVLSVAYEPTVPFTIAGTMLILVGTGMAFVFRYRALYGLHDAASGTLRLALVPRWSHGNDAAEEELRGIVAMLANAGFADATVHPHGAGDSFAEETEIDKPAYEATRAAVETNG